MGLERFGASKHEACEACEACGMHPGLHFFGPEYMNPREPPSTLQEHSVKHHEVIGNMATS